MQGQQQRTGGDAVEGPVAEHDALVVADADGRAWGRRGRAIVAVGHAAGGRDRCTRARARVESSASGALGQEESIAMAAAQTRKLRAACY
jgi:hypothetical protein